MISFSLFENDQKTSLALIELNWNFKASMSPKALFSFSVSYPNDIN